MDVLNEKQIYQDIVVPALANLSAALVPAVEAAFARRLSSLEGWTVTIGPFTIPAIVVVLSGPKPDPALH